MRWITPCSIRIIIYLFIYGAHTHLNELSWPRAKTNERTNERREESRKEKLSRAVNNVRNSKRLLL